MSLLERVRAALDGWGQIREIEMLGGLVFEWDGDPLVGVVNEELIVRVPDGWEIATGNLADLIERAADVVLAECVDRWHDELKAGGHDAAQAMLNLVRHDPDREQLQRILLDLTCSTCLGLHRLAVTCLGHIGRIDGEVVPEVVPRLRELLADPELGGTAEDALGDVESGQNRTNGPPVKNS